jgi:branched-chain amino acid transport system substrate-binding protein
MIRRIVAVFGLIPLALVVSCAGPNQQARVSARPNAIEQMPPREAAELWNRAEQADKAGNATSAISIWERIAQTYSNNMIAARALYKAGDKYLSLGKADRALQFFDYLLYNYPDWSGANLAKLDRFRALLALGRQKEVMKGAVPLWKAASGQTDVLVPLSLMMSKLYEEENDTGTSLEWISAGFSTTSSPDDVKALSNAAVDLLKDKDESTVKKLYKKKFPDVLKGFLDYRLAQIDIQNGKSDEARDRLNLILNQQPSHPLAAQIRAELRQAGPGKPLPPPPVAAAVAPPPEISKTLHANRIGCLVPLNGAYAAYGQMVLRGLNLAISDWNERHPDDGVSLVVKDTQTDAESARNAFQDLVKNDGVLGIVGPLGAQSAKAVAPLANEWGIPMLALTQNEDGASSGPYVVHVFLDNHELVENLVRYCRQKLGFTRFATLYPDDRYGQSLSKIFSEVVNEQGGKLLASVPYRDKSTDFQGPIQKLMKLAKDNVPPTGVDTTPFEALFIPDQVQTVSLIAPQLPYYNVIGEILLGTNLWGEGPFVETGGAYVDQAIMSTPFYPESKSPPVSAFREKYQGLYGTAPSYLEAQAYDAMMLLLYARSGLDPSSLSRSSLMQNLRQVRNFRGVAGDYTYNVNGSMSRKYLLLQVSQGELQQVSP